MNIAFPAVVIFLLLFPGVVFRNAFLQSEDKSASTATPLTTAAALAFIYALMLHFVWVFFATLFGFKIDYFSLLVILTSDRDNLAAAIKVVAASINWIALYFATLLAASWLLGLAFRFVVSTFNLDHGENWLAKRLKNDTPWYYYFSDFESDTKDMPAAVYISALTEVGGLIFIYEGFLRSYKLNSSGQLDRIVLQNVDRRLICEDKNSGTDIFEGNSHEISGDNMVIPMSEIKNFNIQYLYTEDAD
ncbi:hypothetical protein [Teredinibacter turnerae]|uniref:hypothetical protein n=1 Tax=Teredinibacter turnerae TaxID=2426 RepID=UPI00035FB65F|nr:hypothetical protein [Teredinibacter turnerae]